MKSLKGPSHVKKSRIHRTIRIFKTRAIAVVKSRLFKRIYVPSTLVILFLTTLLWSYLGAKLQQANADQLVNAYLFQDHKTLQGAVFPGPHSFLIKWPFFYLIKAFGYSSLAFIGVTMALAVVTVAGLAAIVFWIERRAMVASTLCLALASILLMIPAQPYAGGLLPVNMAMATTRNIEYILYIASVALIVYKTGLRSWQFWIGITGLGLLIASDRLFLTLSLGGALIAFVSYALRQRWKLVNMAVSWLVAGVLAALLASGIIFLLQSAHVTHIASASQTTPYALVHAPKDIALGLIYGVSGLLTNFGANPAYDAVTLASIPSKVFHHMLSIGGPAYFVNLAIFVVGILISARLLLISLQLKKAATPRLDPPYRLTMALLWTGLAACGAFVATSHYYAVDERYIAVCLFAVFVAMALYTRRKTVRPLQLSAVIVVLVVAIVSGVGSSVQTYQNQSQALQSVANRNMTVASILDKHKVSLLVGDYWRVLPVKEISYGKQNVLPLENCTTPRTVLTSASWQPSLHTHSFAYLLTLDGSLTNYPHCNLQQVETVYGNPDASALIAGTFSAPKELILFYDRGQPTQSALARNASRPIGTVLPLLLSDLIHTSCPVPTIMNIVAHEDDDLLFMSPDLAHDVQAHLCVRTVYITAGDSGQDSGYWLSREQGSEAAYSHMLGTKNSWTQRIIQLGDHQYVTVANPHGNSQVSLIFMHLPDGNLKGNGFGTAHYESLNKLDRGNIATMHTVDGQSKYTDDQLEKALVNLLHTYQPTEVRTQSNYNSSEFPDHSDHMAVGRFVKRAFATYENEQFHGSVQVPLKFYIGYPVHGMPSNVSTDDLASKSTAFFAYAHFDGGVCQDDQECRRTPTYESYLTRQYQSDY